MEFIEQFGNLSSNGLFNTFVAIIGAIGVLHDILKEIKPSKRIRYKIARKGNEYLLCFWNASRLFINKEDIFHFNILGNKNIVCHLMHQTDVDIPITCKSAHETDPNEWHCEKEIRNMIKNGRMGLIDFGVELLPPKSGAIFHLVNQSPDDRNFGFFVNGRIRGGKADSIACAVRSNYQQEPWKSTISYSNALYLLMVCCVLDYMLDLVLILESTPKNIPVWVALITCCMMGVVEVRRKIKDGMPVNLWSQYRRMCKKDGFKPSYKKYDYHR